MVHHGQFILAVMKDVPNMHREEVMEDSVLDMVPRGKLAVLNDAQIRHRREEFVTDMVQR